MGYYEEKKRELAELLKLLRKEKADFENMAMIERHKLDRQMSKIDLEMAGMKAKIDAYSRKVDGELEQKRRKVDEELEQKRKELTNLENQVAESKKAINQLAKEKSQGFPWLAQAYADYLHLQDLEKAGYLEHKSHPAQKAAEEVRKVAAQRRMAEKLYRVLKYQLEYYENLFPWLVDFKGEDIEDLIIQIIEKRETGKEDIGEPDDPAKKWLTPAEYAKLPTAEKYQLALDRYWQKKKSKWEIGRDYERYIGYLYESRGYAVYYQGIVEGLADLGRDLICRKDNTVEVVQCKYWSKEKQIHEKHIFQLYGTGVAYRIDHSQQQVLACFVTSTSLSERAHQFANELKIRILENFTLERYPAIKCNVARRDGTKIYHLPFDQQYDRTLVEEERNECYVETVAEAEALGFRRAFRWRGEAHE